jgi:exosortase
MFKEICMSVPVPATKNVWRGILILSAVGFAYFWVLVRLSRDWWFDENYSHGLLIPFIIGYILWLQRDKLAEARSAPSTLWGGLLIGGGLFGLWAGVAGAELYTQRISLIILIIGVVVYFWGARILQLLIFPLVLLFLAMPIPAIVFNKIAFPLQLFASRCAVWSMRMLDIPVLRQGNVIELMPLNAVHTKKLEVVEACSGIRSLMTLITLAVVFAYFTYPPRRESESGQPKQSWYRSYGFWRTFLIIGLAIPIAIITNAMRVSGTGILARYYGTEVADGFFHSFSGWVVYIVAFLMLFAVGWILDRIVGMATPKKPDGDAPKLERPFVKSSVPVKMVAESEGND